MGILVEVESLFCPFCLGYTKQKMDLNKYREHICEECKKAFTLQESNLAYYREITKK